MTDTTMIRPTLTKDRFDLIRRAIARAFQVNELDVTGLGRGNQQVASARLALYVLLYETTSASLTAIATICQRNHHTTVLDGIQRVQTWPASAPAYWQALATARQEAA